MPDRTELSQSSKDSSNALMAWLIGPVFLLLALLLYFHSEAEELPLIVRPAVSHQDIAPGSLRKLLDDPPRVKVNAYERTCQECHQIFESSLETPAQLRQHETIVMDHGMNRECFNCHDREDRNRLVLRGGRTIAFTQVEMLCAQCHGTTYRDWQKGMHGKTLGYWDRADGNPRRLRCSECHDPHAPAFDLFAPLPGPHTLRMGHPLRAPAHSPPAGRPNPLRTWSSHTASETTH